MILIAPDKFKGSLTAAEAARAIAEGLRRGGWSGEVALRPMADGGEGMPAELGGWPVVSTSELVGMANRDLMARGLLDRSSAALGRELVERYGAGAAKVWLAVGGTMTADGGAGALQAMGVRFIGAEGRDMTPRLLAEREWEVDLTHFDAEGWRRRLHLLCDVEATLTGPGLSALDFAAQKGASEGDIDVVRRGLDHLRRALGAPEPSAVDGAGGGIGFAFAGFVGAPWSKGAEAMIEAMDVDWPRVRLIVSGEGRIDAQTAGGKTVEALRREAARRGIPFVAIGGYVEPELRNATTLSTIDTPAAYDPALAYARLRTAAQRIKNQVLL